MRSSRIASVVLLLSTALALPACKQTAQSGADQAASAGATSSSGPEAKPGIALSNVRLVLPAVGGNPAALYFTVANSGTSAATLVAVHIDGTDRAEMHETAGSMMKPLASVVISPGSIAEFAPGGKHVMVYGLAASALLGKTPEVTLTFEDGDKVSAKAILQAAGSAGDMSRMKM